MSPASWGPMPCSGRLWDKPTSHSSSVPYSRRPPTPSSTSTSTASRTSRQATSPQPSSNSSDSSPADRSNATSSSAAYTRTTTTKSNTSSTTNTLPHSCAPPQERSACWDHSTPHTHKPSTPSHNADAP